MSKCDSSKIGKGKLQEDRHSKKHWQTSQQPWYAVFLDLKKAYDTLDRRRALLILEGYGVGENIRRILEGVWDMDTMVPKQAGFFWQIFQGESRSATGGH